MSLTHETSYFEGFTDVDLEESSEDERGFELNAQQADAVEAIHAFMADPDAQFFGLYGYAGTGKTTTIHEALADARDYGIYSIAMSAPTHKAVGVLAQMEGASSRTDFSTIHRLLNCKKQYKDGEIFFAPKAGKKQAILSYDLVVVDECSMIGGQMWRWIREAVEGTSIKVIMMGDPLQLPPVDDGEASPTFNLPCARLTRIMRHQGVIEEAASAMRKAVDADELPLAEDATDDHGEVVNLGQSKFMARLLGDLRKCKVLAYTNKAVNWINEHIRMELFGPDARPFEEGERLVLVKTYDNDNHGMLHTETEINVEAVERADHLDLDCWMLEVTDDRGGRHELYCLDDGQKGEFYKRLKKARNRGKAGGGWQPYYKLKEGFAQVRPGWATTIHKSQGSTYDHVYLIQTNVLSTAGHDHKTCAMLLYVAYSRARKKLILS